MGRRLTHEEFLSRLEKVHPNRFEVLRKYQESHTKILVKCLVCGYKWEIKPNNLLSGQGCPECARVSQGKRQRKTHKEYLQELKKVNPKIEVLGKYKGSNTKILVRCKIDGHEWEVRPSVLLNMRQGCPECASKRRKKTHKEFLQELKKVNPKIEVLEKYQNAKTKILVRCKIDGHEWRVTPLNILKRSGCPKCARKSTESKKEKFLDKTLSSLCVEFQREYPLDVPETAIKEAETEGVGFVRGTAYFDFYLPKYRLIIELDGAQHFYEVEYFKTPLKESWFRDIVKGQIVKDEGLILVRVPYTVKENDIEKALQNLVKKGKVEALLPLHLEWKRLFDAIDISNFK